jgi:hypothetical protein
VQASVGVPYPKEFRTVRDNRALLEQIAARTGGRVLRLGTTAGIDVFERKDLPVPESARRMWDLLAILAAVLFLLDVAVRRVAIDWAGARGGLRDAMAVRQAGDGSVAAWRKARASASKRGGAEPAASATVDRLADGPALDVRDELAQGAAASGGSGAAPRRPGPRADADPGSEPEDTTSRLLRAKRRAHGDERAGEDGERR